MADDPHLDRLRAISESLTEKEKADALLDRTLFKQIIDGLPVALLVVDRQGKIYMVNQQLEIMFGYPRDMLIGQYFDILIPPDLKEIHAKHFSGYLETPYVRPMNQSRPLSGIRYDGTPIKVRINLGPLVSPRGGVMGMAIIQRVTDEPVP